MTDNLETIVAEALVEAYPATADFVRLGLVNGFTGAELKELFRLRYGDMPRIYNDLVQVVDYLAKEN